MLTADDQRTRRHWGLIGTILWGLLIAVIYVGVQGLTVGIYIGITKGNISPSELKSILPELKFDGLLLSLATFVAVLVCVPLILIVVKLKRGSTIKESLGLILPNKRQLWLWVFVVIAFCILSDLASLALNKPIVPEFMDKTYSSIKSPWILCIALLFAAPLFEELFFRGFLITGLAGSPLRPLGAVIISSAAWATVHVQYDTLGIVTIFCLGLILGAARIRTSSTVLTMILHCLVNLGATIETVIRTHRGFA